MQEQWWEARKVPRGGKRNCMENESAEFNGKLHRKPRTIERRKIIKVLVKRKCIEKESEEWKSYCKLRTIERRKIIKRKKF